MKKFLLLLVAAILFVHFCDAQAPQYIPWQAVVRDTNWTPLPNQSVSFRFTIHTDSSTGTTVYQETQSTTTNQLGIVNLQIGSGTVISGTFDSIKWASGGKYLQVELDPTGGSSFTTMGAPQMMSVPYALYAGTSGAPPVTNSAWGLTGNSGTTPGVEYLGTNDETPLYLAVNAIPIFALTLPSSPNLGSGIYTQDSAGDALFTAFTDFYGGTLLNAALGDFNQNFNSTHIGIKDGNSMIELRTDSIVKIAPGSGSSVPIAQFNENSNNIFLNANTEIGTTNAAGVTLRVDGTLNFTTGNQGLGYVLTSDASGNADWQPGGWGLTGNAGTSYPTNHIGTSDDVSFGLATNNRFPQILVADPYQYGLTGVFITDTLGNYMFQAINGFQGHEQKGVSVVLGDVGGNYNSNSIGVIDLNNTIVITTDSVLSVIAPTTNTPIFQTNSNSNNIFLNANTEIGTTNAAGVTLRVDGTLNFTTGNQGLGFVLTSDASGNADWASIANSAWGLTGNSGTNPLTNFIGSTDGAQVNLQEDQDSIGIDLFTIGSSPSLVRNINAVGDVFTVQNRYGFQPFAVSIAGGLGDTIVSITGANFQYQDAAGTYLNGAGQVLTSDASGNASWQLPFSTGIVASSGAPTIAAGTGAGTSPSVSVSGTNIGGLVTVTTGSSPGASSTLVTVTYNSLTYPNNSYVMLYPANAATAVLHGAAAVFALGSTGNFIIGTGSTALTSSVTYIWNYVVVGN